MAPPPAKKPKTHHPNNTRKCAACNQVKESKSFSKNQRNKGENSKCKACCQGPSPTTKECSNCKVKKLLKEYWKSQRKLQEGIAVCSECKKAEEAMKRAEKQACLEKIRAAEAEEAMKRAEKQACLEKIRAAEDEHDKCFEKLPRVCSSCGEKKTSESFSENQWNASQLSATLELGHYFDTNTQRKCLECFPREQEDEMLRQEQLERERQEQERQEKEYIKEALAIKNECGCVCYRFPQHPHEELSFKETVHASDICGVYDVIYQCSFFYGGTEERTTRGKMTIVEEGGLLHGRVDIDPTVGVGPGFHFNADFSFDEKPQKKDSATTPWEANFVVSGLDPDVEEAVMDVQELTATLKVIDGRFACPWTTNEQDTSNENLPFKFETLEEAEKIAKDAKKDYSASWLCNHMGMDAFLAKHIHEFVAWRLDPVFFFEKDDLLLDVTWDDSYWYREPAGSFLIARKVIEE